MVRAWVRIREDWVSIHTILVRFGVKIEFKNVKVLSFSLRVSHSHLATTQCLFLVPALVMDRFDLVNRV